MSTPAPDFSARSQRLSQAHRHGELRREVGELSRRFKSLFHRLAVDLKSKQRTVRGAEWLLDNDYVIQRATRLVRKSLPAHYVRQLPALADNGKLRVRELADYALQTGGIPTDIDWLAQMLTRYQQTNPLSIGELWALPAMLRLSVLDRLVRAAEDLVEADPSDATASAGSVANEIAGLVVSLRTIEVHNWLAFVEEIGPLEPILGADPSGHYALMETATRIRYRQQIEKIARQAGKCETEVATQALALANKHPHDDRRQHIGYYLIDHGRSTLEAAVGARVPWWRRVARRARKAAAPIYMGTITLLALLIAIPIVSVLSAAGTHPALLAATGLPLFIVASAIASACVNWCVTLMVPPHVLPKLDFQKSVTLDCRAAVALPVILATPEDVAPILSRLELNYLGNAEPNLHYVLLTDLADASSQTLPGDGAVLDALRTGIEDMAKRHTHGRFFWLHRPRLYNAVAKTWMGWERKRGKLTDFNRLLIDGDASAFGPCWGEFTELQGLRFAITLDADTLLPTGAAQRLLGTLAHPLNRARFDPQSGQLCAGYTIIQPRVETSPESANRSAFARAYAGDALLDLYSTAVSDVYHDLIGSAIFAGKAAYDVAAMERTLENRIPENAILSHDLFEGLHGAVGLASDITVFEDFPPSVPAFMRRLHRWVRGDWQLLPWLLRRVPCAGGVRRPTRFSSMDRWKIGDNLRRSLQAPALFALLALGWLALPVPPWWVAVAVVVTLALPLWLGLASGAVAMLHPRAETRRAIATTGWSVRQELHRTLLGLMLLPYQAMICSDAIARTLWRLRFGRAKLLEWIPAAVADRRLGPSLSPVTVLRETDAVLQLVVLFGAALVGFVAAGLAPLHLMWFAGPALAVWLSAVAWIGPLSRVTPEIAPQDLTDVDRRELRLLARKTWSFFEAYVGPDHHWLPPDNLHVEPREFVAERTSPTNIGLLLVSTLAAYDQGYLTTTGLAARLGHTLDTLEQLPRHHGHFLNWYHTRTLEPLEPRYVSTVDSGNLVGALLVVAEGLHDTARDALVDGPLRAGFHDSVDVLREHLLSFCDTRDVEAMAACDALLDALPQTRCARTWRGALIDANQALLPRLAESITQLVEQRDAQFTSEEVGALRADLGLIRHLLEDMLAVCDRRLPWLDPAARAAQPLGATSKHWFAALDTPTSLETLPRWCALRAEELSEHDVDEWTGAMRRALVEARRRARQDLAELQALWARCLRLANATDFGVLYDGERHLFRIGYNVSASEFDPNHYDLLASEARLASYIAIAKRQIPVKHWLHLGRPFTRLGARRVLVSWSATAFEYLMPRLFMESPRRGVMDQSCAAAVSRQVRFGAGHNVPWGISESGFYELDEQSHYQYRAFGVPGLGLKREAEFRLVISPYASLLALPYAAAQVVANLRRIAEFGGLGRYGAFEALDFGAAGDREASRASVVHSYMSHHQGMILTAIANALHGDIMVRRFHRQREMQRVDYLLYERLPPGVPNKLGYRSAGHDTLPAGTAHGLVSWSPHEAQQVNLLSNGRLHAHVASHGAMRLLWRDVQLTRGTLLAPATESSRRIYLRDVDDGRTWSPCELALGEAGHLLFAPHEVQFHASDQGLRCRLDAVIAQDHDVEIVRLTLTNTGRRERHLKALQYMEPVLSSAADDARHPGFNKLFVETQLSSPDTLIFKRRPRGTHERPLYVAQSLVGAGKDAVLCCTDRGEFLGRGGGYRDPDWMRRASPATPKVQPSLDPIGALGTELALAPQQSVQLVWLTAVGLSRRRLLDSLHHYRQRQHAAWAFWQARFASERELQDLGLIPTRVPLTMSVVSRLFALHGDRAPNLDTARAVATNLWSRGISGDWPIVLVNLRHASDIDLARDAVLAHRYCRARGIVADVVILDHVSAGYSQPTRDELQRLADRANQGAQSSRSGRVILVAAGDLSSAAAGAIAAAARVTLDSANGPIETQLLPTERPAPPPPFVPMASAAATAPIEDVPRERPTDLVLDNGLGGFSSDGDDYVLHLADKDLPPQPWINVLANPRFGSLVSASGAMFTWCCNSGESRLTPWLNDPVRDPTGEAIYLRDEETAAVWSPTPRPTPGVQPYQVRHGVGYTRFLHRSHGLDQSLCVHVDVERPVKFMRLTLRNRLARPRRITATCYAEWVLGTERESSAPYIVPECVPEHAALLARNAFVGDGAGGSADATAFMTCSLPLHGMTTDRHEFLGAECDTANPAALSRIGLSGRLDAGLDPCAAMQVHVDLPANASVEFHFVLGQGPDRYAALALIKQVRRDEAAATSLHKNDTYWRGALGGCHVDSPEPAFNLLVNRCLLYQAQACRLWARAALYQCGGGLGFRDQLQDVMALTPHQPQLARRQILDAACSQFVEGDVLHWWHTEPRRGVRTRCSDDLLWLPFVTSHYVEVTGDVSILGSERPFLRAPPLGDDELERYAEFPDTLFSASLYEHCWRAIDRALSLRGPHGLPLIGTCDWNDGLSRVGVEGKGESVWLAWFLIATCKRFAPYCSQLGDGVRADSYKRAIAELERAVETHGWDGAWYLRAYYDDGTPLGSARADECRIDLNAQSWSIIAGVADDGRAAQAMDSALRELVVHEDRLIRLLSPPFDKTPQDPGYIKGYPSGVRENGAQYTHAAIWAVWALADMGRRDDATALLAYLNPLTRCTDREAVEAYRVEPYVMAADVYGVAPFSGRGGWTWYTGAAGWMYRLAVERILGLRKHGDELEIRPLLPSAWPGYTAHWRHGSSTYTINVRSHSADDDAPPIRLTVDGVAVHGRGIVLRDDGRQHNVQVDLRQAPDTSYLCAQVGIDNPKTA